MIRLKCALVHFFEAQKERTKSKFKIRIFDSAQKALQIVLMKFYNQLKIINLQYLKKLNSIYKSNYTRYDKTL